MTEEDRSTLTVAAAPRYTLIWIGVLIGVVFYISDAFMDTMLFSEATFTGQLLHPTLHELWMRLIVLVVATRFGF